MKVSEIMRQAQAGTVDGQIKLLGDYAISEISRMLQKLGSEAGDMKRYVSMADFRSWKNAAERVFQDLKSFMEAEGISGNSLPADYKAGDSPR